MKYILLIAIICLIIFVIKILPCKDFIEADNGNYYRARNKYSANKIDKLREISHDLINKLNKKDSIRLKNRLKNTSFGELMGGNKNIIAYNTDKGREIYIRLYNEKTNAPVDSELIIKALLHELAHSLVDNFGHGEEFENKDNELQKFRNFYLDKYTKK